MTDPSSGGPTSDGGVSEEFDGVDPVSDDADGSGETGRSRGIAIVTAVALGATGMGIVIASSGVVFGINQAVGGLSLAASVALTLIIGQYVGFGGLSLGYLRWRGFDREGIVSYLGVRAPSLKEVGLVFGGWVAILVLFFVSTTVVQLIGADTASNQSAELAMRNPAIIPLLIAASFLVIGPSEEILYRGIVQGRLRESLPAAPSIAIASAIFAAIHVIALTGGLSGRLTSIALLFFPSLVFGAVYEYTENLVVPALLHGLHNAVLFTAIYVFVTQGGEVAAVLPAW